MVEFENEQNCQITTDVRSSQSHVYILSCSVPFFNKAELGLVFKYLLDLIGRDMMFAGKLTLDLIEPNEAIDSHG